jgi:glycosyltransferase involved in cell wall biosynthesis
MDVPAAVSLVCTVRNEADNIAALLDSMLDQTHPADEIIVNDCGSRDATAAIVERYIAAGLPIRLVRGGHNIPSGRNNAIRHARGPLIASTDAGLTLDRRWLESIVAPLKSGAADVVGGFFRPAPRSLFELALGATNYRQLEEIDPTHFLPFGKSVAFRKEAWQQVGGYPEWASHCEDLLFALALQRAGYRFAFAPGALVLFRPRESLRAFARQYFLYARGDGVANLWPRRHLLRYVTYISAGLLAGMALSQPRLGRRAWLLGLLGSGAYAYTRAPLRRLHARAPALAPHELAMTTALIPAIRLVGDLAKMAGYPVGVLQRLCSSALRQAIEDYKRPVHRTDA